MDIARKHPYYTLIFALLLYIAGIVAMQKENSLYEHDTAVVQRQNRVYVDNEGEEHDSESLMEIQGVGFVLAYKDVYLSTFVLIIPFLIAGKFVFGEQNELLPVLFGFVVIGMFLIWLTSKPNIYSTIFYWLGILTLSLLKKQIK